jgi:predicted GNAT family acetyltransferase
MAGASADCAELWQIGIDVLPEYRGKGIAAALVSKLAIEILKRGKVPYYGTSPCNIASQSVAHRAGFKPAWACAFGGKFGDVVTAASG